MQMSFFGINMERIGFRPGAAHRQFQIAPFGIYPAPGSPTAIPAITCWDMSLKISGLRYQRYIEDNLQTARDESYWFDSTGHHYSNRVSGYRRDGIVQKYRLLEARPFCIQPGTDLHRPRLYSNRLLGALYGTTAQKGNAEKAFAPMCIERQGLDRVWVAATNTSGTDNGVRSIEHQGGLPAFRTWETYYPGKQDVFIIDFCAIAALRRG